MARKPPPKPKRKAKPKALAKPRKKPATAGRKSKPWRHQNRLQLLPLEAAVEKLVIQRTPDRAIADWVRAQAGYTGTTDAQVAGLITGIRERWRAAYDDPGNLARRRAEHEQMLDAAIHDAWNRPVFRMNPDTGAWEPVLNPDGTQAVQTDHKALPQYLKLRGQFYGFEAPAQHLHIHGKVAPPAALSPAERRAEIDELLERRRRAELAAGKPDPGPPIDTTATERRGTR